MKEILDGIRLRMPTTRLWRSWIFLSWKREISGTNRNRAFLHEWVSVYESITLPRVKFRDMKC